MRNYSIWVIDYPLFERIHYLLVAGFDVYGNLGHRMSTRIYMDFLRMEGEDYLLVFLSVNQRKAIRNQEDYKKFVERYGVRRTDPDFWQTAGWFQAEAARSQVIRSGLFDLNRYHNR